MADGRLENFRKLAEAHPGNPLYRFSLGQCLMREGAAAEAEPHLRLAAASRTDWMMARILLGQCLEMQGRRAEARPVMEEALALAVSQGHEEPEQDLREWLAKGG